MPESLLKSRLIAAFAVVIAVGVVTTLVLAVALYSQFLKRNRTHNDLKWIGLALHRYHEVHGHFPPAVEFDESGAPKHSWRSLIAPQLAAVVPSSSVDDRFSDYDFNEPWDSPGNAESDLRNRFSAHDYQFLAVVGPNAAWKSRGTRTLAEFKDGSSTTILLIAVRNSGIGWRDAVVNGDTLTVGDAELDLSGDVVVLLADGTVRSFAKGIPKDHLAKMLTIDAGDYVSDF